MSTRLIVEQFDPVRPKPGGIDTCIRGLVKFAPDTEIIRIAGVDAIGDKVLGEWKEYEIGGRRFDFMPVVRLDHADLTRRVPHSVRLARGLKKFLPTADVDTVQTHRVNVGAVALRHFRGTPHVQFMHSSGDANLKQGSVSFFRRARGLYRFLERRVVRQSRAVVIFSSGGAERLRRQSASVHFSPTWFDPTEFYPSASESSEKVNVLWACRIEPAKNPELAIAAFALLHERFRLTVAGSGTLEGRMREAAAAAGIAHRVDFRGAVPKGEVGALMREHDLLLMSSRFEGFSRSIVEALATGLPVATTPGGDPNALIVEGVNGARASRDDPAELAAAVERASAASAAVARASVEELNAPLIVDTILSK
ncbi:glycosyltransferase family 4 protein [Rathayibacter sp. VKM Ac-2857]|uniref:glycosyltransferase family 4 protein n=1 Tax=Rathayibacter sp. VKM Ac-2857 TaxID=2739020 RepID=UPI001565174B|nr:glycosyltransferase family 4 protein [Rathayibacter sp. VKM Ac-2857]NQX14726.1 glycosyltransferase family 4 protein [Rathayibacter sp. VKM Ac-2857]